jgi:hypothetical protein
MMGKRKSQTGLVLRIQETLCVLGTGTGTGTWAIQKYCVWKGKVSLNSMNGDGSGLVPLSILHPLHFHKVHIEV